MKYDFVLAVLACAKQKYLDRLISFVKDYGYKFTNKSHINFKIVFLAGETEPHEASLKQLIDIEYDWQYMPDMTVANRFLTYIYTNPVDYKWIFQVDDDSSTDIDRTYEILEDFYNHTDPIMFVSSRTTDLCIIQQLILREMGIKNVFFGKKNIDDYQNPPMIVHSHEASLLSGEAVVRMKLCKKTLDYLLLSHKYGVYWTDNGVGVLSKICKIPVVESTFSDSWVDENKAMKEYSAIKEDGRLTHIHPILNTQVFYNQFIDIFQKNKNIIFKTNFDNLDKNTLNLWKFSGIYNNIENFYGILELKPDGSIGIYQNNNEKYWQKNQNNTISLMNIDHKPTSVLSHKDNNTYIGNFLFDQNIQHKLVKL
jgi:hypothetical protein